MKNVNLILIIVAILGILFAFVCFFKEGLVLDVNSSNMEFIRNSLASLGFCLIIHGMIRLIKEKVN